MSQWLDVCEVDDIAPDTAVCALVNGKQVAIFRPLATDTLFAVDNFDPVGKANVLSRGIISDIQGQLTVASPLYKQHFCLASGQCLEDEALKIPTYPIKTEGRRVYVSAH